MQKITMIGNLTNDPVEREVGDKTVCSFTVAVDRKKTKEKITDFFRINAWDWLGKTCMKYLSKGRKVAVVGELQARLYDAKNGEQRLSLDVSADEIEFLSPAEKAETKPEKNTKSSDDWMTIASNDLPF